MRQQRLDRSTIETLGWQEKISSSAYLSGATKAGDGIAGKHRPTVVRPSSEHTQRL